MITTLTIPDDDQQRTYTVEVDYTCRPALGQNPREVALDINRVRLAECVVYLNKMGCEVDLSDSERRAWWSREIERQFAEEIEEKCLAAYETQRYEAA